MNNTKELQSILLKILLIFLIFGVSYAIVYLFPLLVTIVLTATASLLIIKRESLWKS
jgi:hypothetical protein